MGGKTDPCLRSDGVFSNHTSPRMIYASSSTRFQMVWRSARVSSVVIIEFSDGFSLTRVHNYVFSRRTQRPPLWNLKNFYSNIKINLSFFRFITSINTHIYYSSGEDTGFYPFPRTAWTLHVVNVTEFSPLKSTYCIYIHRSAFNSPLEIFKSLRVLIVWTLWAHKRRCRIVAQIVAAIRIIDKYWRWRGR